MFSVNEQRFRSIKRLTLEGFFFFFNLTVSEFALKPPFTYFYTILEYRSYVLIQFSKHPGKILKWSSVQFSAMMQRACLY